MTFCDTLQNALGCSIGIYNLEGRLIEGEDIGFKVTENVIYNDVNTYIRTGNYIISARANLSQDACSIIRVMWSASLEKEAADYMQPLEHILKSNVSYESVRGRYLDNTVLYIYANRNILGMLKSIYEGYNAHIVYDGEGYYLVNRAEDIEQEAQSILSDIRQECGVNVIIGCGRRVSDSYTIKQSADHAKKAFYLARSLGFKEGFYHIDKMILYGIIDEVSADDIDFYVKGGYEGFNEVMRDKELIDTAEELLRCHLNISEAARRLYLHRNTLLYRVEKIKNLTGLDIKKFEEAVIFRTIMSIYKLKWR
ncbi:PucR family transcriptional regulator [Fonticella tunisiensis]|uniref:PucR-like helix-turn-helix protein n=1 Tax=Fonticella tunisiensis TaxID=1096341 RepID=A0A4R7KTN4_9CLOT|nr:helix-turn-helix domain-containing protein [Fonticella tunisiensis]TDT63379.1 PucR-like helix-turn-helix protein [Fonticella tunisiensis]